MDVADEPVRELLRRRAVIVDSATSLRDLASILSEELIGAALVRRTVIIEGTVGHSEGIVSERDISRAVAAGLEPDTTQAGDVMTTDLASADADDTILRVATRMLANGIRHLPIREGDAVIGVVSERDVLGGAPATGPGSAEGPPMRRFSRTGLFAALAVIVVAAVGVSVAVVLTRGDREERAGRAPTSTTATTSTIPATTTTPPARSTTPVDLSTAVWPWPSSSVRYQDPVAAAHGFSVDFVGFVDPVVGRSAPVTAARAKYPCDGTRTGRSPRSSCASWATTKPGGCSGRRLPTSCSKNHERSRPSRRRSPCEE